jgi:hypothetical protein
MHAPLTQTHSNAPHHYRVCLLLCVLIWPLDTNICHGRSCSRRWCHKVYCVSLHPSPSLSNHLSFAVLQYIGYLIGRLENKADEQPQAAAAEPKPANTQTPRGTTPHAWRLHWPAATHHTIMEFVEYICI